VGVESDLGGVLARAGSERADIFLFQPIPALPVSAPLHLLLALAAQSFIGASSLGQLQLQIVESSRQAVVFAQKPMLFLHEVVVECPCLEGEADVLILSEGEGVWRHDQKNLRRIHLNQLIDNYYKSSSTT
jgi:hypothetical protein